MKQKLIIGLIILVIVIIGIGFAGYFKNKQKQERKNVFTKNILQEKGQIIPSPLPVVPIPQQGAKQPLTSETQSPYSLLFKEEYLYIDLSYPLLYVYDLNSRVIKYFNLENQTFQEIYRSPLIEEVVLSSDKKNLVFKTRRGFNFLNLNNDSLYKLPQFTKNLIFTPKGLVIYINNNKNISYLAFYEDGRVKKIRNLGILNPRLESLKNSLLIYEKNSPVFLLDLTNPNDFSVFLEAKPYYSLLTNKDKTLIFVSFKDKNWQSQIITPNNEVKFNFSWGTVREKCSFDEVLICAIPMNLENFSPDLWLLKEPTYDEKLIIYNPKNNKIKEIKLEDKFDIVRPKLTPLGIIFWNRLDAKFYLIESKKLPL